MTLAELEAVVRRNPTLGYAPRVWVVRELMAEGHAEAFACIGANTVPLQHSPEFRGWSMHVDQARQAAHKARHDALHAGKPASYQCPECKP